MRITDSAALAGVHETPEGYLEASVRISRTGIQEYLGSELGCPDKPRLRIYRGDDAVFDKATLESFANIPLTVEHPKDLVDSSNWKQHAVGVTGNEILRDGEFLKIGIRVTDADAVAAVKRGKRELSVGYEAQFDKTPGVSPEGEPYDWRQTSILANHLAITDAARAGSKARIGDSWGAAPITDHNQEVTMTMKTVVLGDAAVQVAAEDASKVEAFKAQVAKDAEANSKSKDDTIEELNKKLAERDAKLATLEKQKLSDSDVDKLVASRAKLVSDARTVIADYDAAGKTDAQIKLDVVKQSGQFEVNDSTDPAYINVAFDLLAAGKVGAPVNDSVRMALKDAKPASGDDAVWGRALDSLPNAKKEG